MAVFVYFGHWLSILERSPMSIGTANLQQLSVQNFWGWTAGSWINLCQHFLNISSSIFTSSSAFLTKGYTGLKGIQATMECVNTPMKDTTSEFKRTNTRNDNRAFFSMFTLCPLLFSYYNLEDISHESINKFLSNLVERSLRDLECSYCIDIKEVCVCSFSSMVCKMWHLFNQRSVSIIAPGRSDYQAPDVRSHRLLLLPEAWNCSHV